jgi:hypothetical protein
MYTPETRRRLRIAAHALALLDGPRPQTPAALRAFAETLHEGIAALQSLDDLGRERNREVELWSWRLGLAYDATMRRAEFLEREEQARREP